MATIESECAAVDRCLLDAVKSNEDPSYFENSCTGLQRFDNLKITANVKWRDFTSATV